MAALVLFAAAASQAPPAASALGITAEQAMAHYRAMTSGVIVEKPSESCPDSAADQIVVCARRHGPPPRLPFPDERAEAGEAVHHLGEPAAGDPGAPSGPPSKQMQTLKKGFGLLKSVITGEDPGD